MPYKTAQIAIGEKFGRLTVELDRVDPDGPYSPENCRWLCRRGNAKRARAIWDADFSAEVAQYASDHGLTPWELMTLAVGRLLHPEISGAEEATAERREEVRGKDA